MYLSHRSFSVSIALSARQTIILVIHRELLTGQPPSATDVAQPLIHAPIPTSVTALTLSRLSLLPFARLYLLGERRHRRIAKVSSRDDAAYT